MSTNHNHHHHHPSKSSNDGHVHRVCVKCMGEGRVVAKQRRTKKSRQQYKRAKAAATRENKEFIPLPLPELRYEQCGCCSGSGLILASKNLDLSHLKNEDEVALREHQHQSIEKHVAIIGGGIGGIALALSLQHRNIPYTVYERDSSFAERRQGYGLTMQQGAKALKGLGFDYANAYSYACSDGTSGAEIERFGIHSKRHIVHKSDGTKVGEWGMKIWGRNKESDAGRQNAHISRQELRRLLMDRVDSERIKWGYKLIDFVEGDDGVLMRFDTKDGHVSAHADLIVGADGIRSAVRKQKLQDHYPLRYLGCIVVLGITATPKSSLVDGETVFQTADGVTRLYAMPFAAAGKATAGTKTDYGVDPCRGETMWQLSFPMKEEDAKRLSAGGAIALKKEAMSRCGFWHDPVPTLLETTPEHLISGYPVYDREILDGGMLRAGCDNRKNSRVTLIGDAAHPMSPFKGQGANQALIDSLSLARSLFRVFTSAGEPNDDIATALEEYEIEMLNRSRPKVKASAEAAQFLHTEIAIKKGNVTRGAAASDLNGEISSN
eukprot:CAMPEP_0196820926 /NCGR_PEP_ID=MMETSP1362-20130617/77115_1 /TAXON_ID=163516 /ORGANISM="Leptocylindrus danicus, Strain CCMP1856" /LENGTH=549 /DNA_ID=CAMNT_0042199961 /DNA_START=533 /DNA_END=2182 /DNA_ORIENTATION=+